MSPTSQTSANVIIVGGGIIGLATAWKLRQRLPEVRITLLEKENRLAAHQSGHNSGVLHSGIYYKPGSLKAKLATQGRTEMIRFCEEHEISHDVCGKVIVAVKKQAIPRLDILEQRATANGVDARRIQLDELKQREPHVTGMAALFVSGAGITDFRQVCDKLGTLLSQSGVKLQLGALVTGISEENQYVKVATSVGELAADCVVTCGGLHSDRLARFVDPEMSTKILPFRGEYFELAPDKKYLVNSLVYPVPDPNFPFLGVHLTRMIDGSVHVGPNAVLALCREGYSWRKANFRDLNEIAMNPGWWKLARNYWRVGMAEIYRSFSKTAFVDSVRQLVPAIQAQDLIPSSAGVRAQAVSREGMLLDDFVWSESNRVLNIINAPSPAATASFAIGQQIVDRLMKHLE